MDYVKSRARNLIYHMQYQVVINIRHLSNSEVAAVAYFTALIHHLPGHVA
jgi:hypothetical protein